MLALRAHGKTGTHVAPVCAGIFGLTWPGDERLVLRRLADVADQAFQVRTLAEDLPASENAEMLLADFGQIEQVVAGLPAAGNLEMVHLIQHVTDAGWRSLDLAEHLVARHHQEPKLDDDTVEQLLGKVRALIDEVTQSVDLDGRTRTALVRRLQRVEEALLNVRITGAVAVEEAAEGLVGHLVNTPPEKQQNPVLGKIAELACTALMAVASATGAMVPQLIAGDGNPPPKPPAVVVLEQVIPRAPISLPGTVENPTQPNADQPTTP